MTAKGMALERYLDGLHGLYVAQGRALIFKVPTPRSFAGMVRPAVFVDYSGAIDGGMAVCLEAKMCTYTKVNRRRSFPLCNITKGQRGVMTAMHAMGAISAVYVRGGDEVQSADYLVPTVYIDALAKKSFRWDEVQHYKVPPGQTWLDAIDAVLPHHHKPSPSDAWAWYMQQGWR